MNARGLLGLGVVGIWLASCGGTVSLGDANQALGGANADAGSKKDCSASNACGPALGMPSKQCSDGSIGGSTGRCLPTADGGCGWEVRECPSGGACFDQAGELDVSMRTCNVTADCAVVTFAQNCCGTLRANGVNTASQSKAQACGDARGKGFPGCECASRGTVADDGTTDLNGGAASVTCSSAGRCETTFGRLKWYTTCGDPICQAPPDAGTSTPPTCAPVGAACSTKGETCGDPKLSCGSVQVCDDHDPKVGGCPISTRKAKDDIAYVDAAELQRLHDETVSMRLATYRYTGPFVDPNNPNAKHLGFIVEDQPQSLSVDRGHDRVDLYGYMSMAVATMQVQEKEISALRRELSDIKASCVKKR